MSLSISSTVKTYPRLPYAAIAEAILGPRYAVSLVFIGSTRAQQLNESTRGKTYIPNVLSFELDPKAGEIYITPGLAQKEAKNFNLTPRGYIGYLFIHGCLHLKGLPHGSKMDNLETTYLKQFKLK